MSDLVFIVDAFSLMFQVFHAIPPMTSPEGLPTNAVFGFTRDMMAMLRDHAPTHFVVAFDSAGPAVRTDIYEEYKANRAEMPEDLVPQIALIKEMLAGMRIPAVEHAGWEADDIIATLAREAREAGMEVRIVTNDKDIRQLLDDHTQVYNVRKNEFQGPDFLMQEWGIRPEQVVDFQALVGDKVDNVPGVPLVGPKKARALIEQYGTLEEVLAHADEVSGKKLSQNLREFADQARVSRELVKLNTHLPLEANWNEFRVEPVDHDRLREFFVRLGFRRFANDMRELAEPGAADEQRPQPTIRRIESIAEWASLVEELNSSQTLSLKLIESGNRPLRSEILGAAVSADGIDVAVACCGPDDSIPLKQVLDDLKKLVESESRQLISPHLKRLCLLLARFGIRPRRLGVDSILGGYLLDAGSRELTLPALVEKYLDQSMPAAAPAPRSKQRTMFDDQLDDDQVQQAGFETGIVVPLVAAITERLESESLWDLYRDLESPLIEVLVELELNGIRVDAEELRRQSRELGERLAELKTRIHESAGSEFNIDSPRQLATVLFDELKLPILKKTKTGPSTSQEVLEKLASMHPLPACIIEHRQLSKLKGTYLDALPTLINPDTGRIHATFHQTIAATGRLSSSDPNLQNIPIRTAEGRQIRRAFVPGEPGWQLLCADYSQVELRMLAHFSQDPELIAAFQADHDIHSRVAQEIFGVGESAVESDMRRVAKAVNFGVIYGQSAWGLSESLGIDIDEAGSFIDQYFDRYSGVAEFMERVLDECESTGYARTILGRRRPISGIRRQRNQQRSLPERTAINTVIQGSAADLIKVAMLRVHERLRQTDLDARMLLQIHDELVFEVRDDTLDELARLVREEMESAMQLAVPLVVDIGHGATWLDQQDWIEPGTP